MHNAIHPIILWIPGTQRRASRKIPDIPVLGVSWVSLGVSRGR
jgi:hypothetical protein